jgi:hypothetical protein
MAEEAAAATLLGGDRRCLVGEGGGKEFGGERKMGENENLGERNDVIVSKIVAFGCNQRPGFRNLRNSDLLKSEGIQIPYYGSYTITFMLEVSLKKKP